MMAVCSVGLSFVCLCLFLDASGLLNHGQVSPTVTAYPGDIWNELYGFKKQLDVIHKENQELKKNQSELLSQIQQKQNMSIFSSTDIQTLKDRLDMLENKYNEIENNQTALYLALEKDNKDLMQNHTHFCSEVSNRIGKHETDFGNLNNSFLALSSVQKATASVVTALQGEQIANKLGISGLQRNFSDLSNILYKQINSIDTLDRNMKSEMGTLNSTLQISLTGTFLSYQNDFSLPLSDYQI